VVLITISGAVEARALSKRHPQKHVSEIQTL
jgi:hypothetical protein